MRDLIDRQAAIDAIEQYRDKFDAIETNFLDGLKTAINIVKELPSERIGIKFEEVKDNPAYSRYLFESVPSAQSEIIHCRDCVFGEQDDDEVWFCRNLGCQIGDIYGNGFCSDAERRTE